MSNLLRIEVDGRRAGAEIVWSAMSGHGHFTAMQVRGGKARGLAFHLHRLEMASRELFAADLSGTHVRKLIRHALGDVEDASVRVYVYESDAEPTIIVTVKDPGGISPSHRLQSVRYQRPSAHLKHLATEQGYYSRLARQNGFDDALLTACDGQVSESATANIGFFDASGVVWPDAAFLHGITMQLIEQKLPELGVPSRRRSVRLLDLPSFEEAFLTNARGVAAVSRIDDLSVPASAEYMTMLADAYSSVFWDAI